MFIKKSLENIVGGLQKTLTELEAFKDANGAIVDDLSARLVEAELDQARAERISSKLQDLLS